MDKWQPIETAPKDGSMFLIYSDKRIGMAFISPREHEGLKFLTSGAIVGGPDPYNENRTGMAVSNSYLDMATHWMPLPAPPEESENG